jgi:hypothetical protein
MRLIKWIKSLLRRPMHGTAKLTWATGVNGTQQLTWTSTANGTQQLTWM